MSTKLKSRLLGVVLWAQHTEGHMISMLFLQSKIFCYGLMAEPQLSTVMGPVHFVLLFPWSWFHWSSITCKMYVWVSY